MILNDALLEKLDRPNALRKQIAARTARAAEGKATFKDYADDLNDRSELRALEAIGRSATDFVRAKLREDSVMRLHLPPLPIATV